MTVQPLLPDTATAAPPQTPSALASLADAFGAALNAADSAENAFANGAGSLQHAVYERARAGVALAVATAAAQRTVQSLQSILNMQV